MQVININKFSETIYKHPGFTISGTYSKEDVYTLAPKFLPDGGEGVGYTTIIPESPLSLSNDFYISYTYYSSDESEYYWDHYTGIFYIKFHWTQYESGRSIIVPTSDSIELTITNSDSSTSVIKLNKDHDYKGWYTTTETENTGVYNENEQDMEIGFYSYGEVDVIICDKWFQQLFPTWYTTLKGDTSDAE